VELTYDWLREHSGCPPIDPRHLEIMLETGERDEGKRADRWRKDFAKDDKRKKGLFKRVPRERRGLAAVLLKTAEEIETAAHQPATPEQVAVAARVLDIERAEFALEGSAPEVVTDDMLESLLAGAAPEWQVRPDAEWTLERRGLREAEGLEHSVIGRVLAQYCFDENGRNLAEIEVGQGEIEAEGRGMAVRLRASEIAGTEGRHGLARAALAIEKHLTLHAFTK
jgi:hypothetical protein